MQNNCEHAQNANFPPVAEIAYNRLAGIGWPSDKSFVPTISPPPSRYVAKVHAMFIPSTHIGFVEAFTFFLEARMSDEIREFGLSGDEAAAVARFLIARERVRHSEPGRPRSSRTFGPRQLKATREDVQIVRAGCAAYERIKGQDTSFWSLLEQAWDLMLDDLACGRLKARSYVADRGWATITPQAWLDDENRYAYLAGTLIEPGPWSYIERPVLFLRADITGTGLGVPEPNNPVSPPAPTLSVQASQVAVPAAPKIGRPLRYDWPKFEAAALDKLEYEGGLSATIDFQQSDLEAFMFEWCAKHWSRQPSESTVREHVVKVRNQFQAGKAGKAG